MKGHVFPRAAYGFRTLVLLYTQLLLAVLVLLGTAQAQSTQSSELPRYGYCAPGIPCPNPVEQPSRSGPDNIVDRGQEGQPRTEMEPKERSREEKVRRRRERPYEYYEEDLELLPKPKDYTDFQYFVFSSMGRMLPMYGYDLFEDVPSTFAPVERIPVTADYVIGPGDELVLRGWGQVQIDVRAVVDRTGSIFIPKVGNVHVAGLRYHQLHDYLEPVIGHVFRNFELSVTLGELRSIQVFVVGHARRPGTYTVSSLSTLVNALFASGGPSPAGSMRSIQLKRNNQVVTEFDLYDLLLNGDKSKDAALLPGDVIYVPPIGPLVAVGGSVNVQAIYEIRGKTTLGDALQMAGLLTPTAEGQKATLERIENKTVRKIEEFPLDAGGLARPLQDGDLVGILALSPHIENAVTLKGNVARPGRYPWQPGMRVSDLIPSREMLITRKYWVFQNLAPEGEYGQQAREDALKGIVTNPQHPSVLKTEALASSKVPNDQTKTDQSQADKSQADKSKTDSSIGEAVIRTDVKRNTPEVNWEYAVVQRLQKEDLTTRLLPFNLRKAVLDHEETNNLLLEPGDIVTVFSQADLTVPLAQQTKFIQMEGEFKAAGVYQAQPGDTLRDLVERAGGLTENAYVFGAQFTRESTRVEQQKRLDAFLDQMERDVERAASTASTRAQGSQEEAKALEARADAQRRLVLRLRQVKAKGRVVLEMRAKEPTVADLPNLPLEDGDKLVVPARPATVNVIGAVYNENSLLYRPGKRVSDYLRAAGGPTREADKVRTFVIRADGSLIGRASTSHLWGASFDSMRLMPGDTVVVPERLERSNRSREVRDWATLFSQLALSAAVFHNLAP